MLTSCAIAESPSVRKDLLTTKALTDWEFITATQTALDSVCLAGSDGVITIVGKPTGYLATKIAYENYQLREAAR